MSNWKPYKDGESCYWDKLDQGTKNALGNAGQPRAIEVDQEGYHYKVAQYNGKDGSQFWSVFRKPLAGTVVSQNVKTPTTGTGLNVESAALLGLLNEIAVNTRALPEMLAVMKELLNVARGNGDTSLQSAATSQ